MGLWRWLFRRKRNHERQPFSWQPTPAVVMRDYVDEDGRRHRGDAPYLLPKDDKEMQRLDYQHFILRHVLQGNCFAPVHDLLRRGGSVLDVGCGTGRWGCEIATTYPQAQVIGFDLEEAPRGASTPLNYRFCQGNLFDGLPFADHTFHYVHQRLLVAAVPRDRWPWVIGELRRVTQPGDWIELVEMGNTFYHEGTATRRFLEWWIAIAASRGIDASQMSQLDSLLKYAGLHAVRA